MPPRRSHGSKKVANVKIRPVPEKSSAPKKKIRDEKDDDESETETESERSSDHHNRNGDPVYQEDDVNRQISPLSGYILCSTGFDKPEKSSLAQKAKTMGAKWQESLVEEVTHLIADGVDSPKYQAAIVNNIRVQKSDWIYKLHSLWLDAEYFDFQKLIDQYRTPPLQKAHIFCTAMTPTESENIDSVGNILGASFSSSLQDPNCTHILVGSLHFDPSSLPLPESTPKIVWSSWLNSCHKKWRYISEEDYIWKEDLAPPASKQLLSSPTSYPPRKFKSSFDSQSTTTMLQKRPVKKQRINSSDALSSFGLDILSSKDTNYQKSQTTVTEVESFNPLKPKLAPGPSLSKLHKQSSFISDSTKAPRDLSNKLVSIPDSNAVLDIYINAQLFKENSFITQNMPLDRKEKLTNAIIEKGGFLVDSEQNAKWKIMPFINTGNDCLNAKNENVVSEWWIERCIFEDKIVNPLSNFGCKPINLVPLPDPSKYKITFSALDPCNERFLMRLCKCLNVDVSLNLKKNETTHVLIQSDESNGQKAEKARQWGIPVVNIDWIRKLACGELNQEPRNNQLEPLSGLNIATSDKLDNSQSSKISENILILGGNIIPFNARDGLLDCSTKITHFIHSSDRLNDISKQVSLAKKMDAFICHPAWVDACIAQKKRVCEEAYPHTYVPGRALQMQLSSTNQSKQSLSTPNLGRQSANSNDSNQISPLKEPSLLDKLLKETTKSEINLKKRSLKRESQRSQSSTNSISSLSITKEASMDQDAPLEERFLNNIHDEDNGQERLGIHVTYSDPKAEAARTKLLQQLEKNRKLNNENDSKHNGDDFTFPPQVDVMAESNVHPPEQENPTSKKTYAKRGRRKQPSRR